ncbi:hypothetical protein TNCT_252311 [Trichonephila clavata]|uniref:Integrase zinc-binding domain-containing protein n=1 Tax=Trichonephila clavata TaxID=2740835 RepID=A0A8X6HHE1_TRICU|nr:hypothetical protein TNCT_252311 [Trichonephila clavata]
MELHKWSASNPLLLPDSMRQDKDLSYSSTETKTLGLLWKPYPDSFAFKISPMTSNCAEATLANIRNSFWIPSARNVVRKIRRTCITCKKVSAKGSQQLMADLPAARVTTCRVFSQVAPGIGKECENTTTGENKLDEEITAVFAVEWQKCEKTTTEEKKNWKRAAHHLHCNQNHRPRGDPVRSQQGRFDIQKENLRQRGSRKNPGY